MPPPLDDAQVASISARERQRVAHDLHDGLGQLLGGIALKLQALHQILGKKSPPETAHTAELVQLVNEAVLQTRMLSRSLSALPATASLASTLAKLAADTERLFRITCVFQGELPRDAESPQVTEHLFRVAQEAITNALRHGRASRIEMELAHDASGLTLLVRDNGSGFEQRSAPKSGIGLRIMAHRANSIRGTITVEPGTDGGTVVRCHVPQLEGAAEAR